MIPSEKISAFIMAGGKSTRFGSDKTMHKFRGKPLIKHIYDIISPLFEKISIVADDCARYEFLNIDVFPDIIPDHGPLGGVHSALTRTSSERIFVFAADMPCLNRDFITYMSEIPDFYDAIVPVPEGRFEPLHSIYRKSCIGPVEMLLSCGRRKTASLFEQIEVRPVTDEEIFYYDDTLRMFANINRVQDSDEYGAEFSSDLH